MSSWDRWWFFRSTKHNFRLSGSARVAAIMSLMATFRYLFGFWCFPFVERGNKFRCWGDERIAWCLGSNLPVRCVRPQFEWVPHGRVWGRPCAWDDDGDVGRIGQVAKLIPEPMQRPCHLKETDEKDFIHYLPLIWMWWHRRHLMAEKCFWSKSLNSLHLNRQTKWTTLTW